MTLVLLARVFVHVIEKQLFGGKGSTYIRKFEIKIKTVEAGICICNLVFWSIKYTW